jgi:hypothetical protein
MNLEITDINETLGYVSVVDWDTHKEYFSQGEEGQNDIDFILFFGETPFLNYLASSGYFDTQ